MYRCGKSRDYLGEESLVSVHLGVQLIISKSTIGLVYIIYICNTEWLFVRDRTRTGFYRLFVRHATGRFVPSKEEQSEDRFRVRVGLDTSFMAEHDSIIQVKTTVNNESDVFKCV